MRTLLHVSDIHFGPPHRPAISEALRALVAEREPDLVVVAGDLTQRAKPEQFRQARRWVDSLASPVIAVPGNHDVPMYRAAFLERLFAPFAAYRQHFDDDLEPVFEDDELFVVGINSAWNWTLKEGYVSSRQIARAVERFAGAGENRCKVAVVHHEMAPAPRFGSQKVLANAEPLVRALAAVGVELVLSGHLHQAYALRAESYYPGVGRAMILAHSGTTTSDRGRGSERDRNTGFWIAIDDGSIAIDTLLWHAGESRFDISSSHRFRRRLE